MMKNLKKNLMLFLGIIAFILMSVLAFIDYTKEDYEIVKYLPYGIIIFIVNIIYLKLIILSRESYETQLRKEKEYSQSLLLSQKLFLRHTVHETNTPLAVIMANIELYELKWGMNSILSNIEAATKNIYSIYGNLHYLTKNDKMDFPKKNLVLLESVKLRLEFFNIVALQSHLSFELHEKADNSIIFINETKLQRIIDNNISNALKYTKEFEVIHVLVFKEKDCCVFEISSYSSIIKDTRKIFNAYFREESNKEGLGLGLNLVKKICKEENVKIELTSNKNITTFKYFFKRI